MQQTLFFFPHWLFEGPLLIGWLIVGALVFAYLFFKHRESGEAWNFLPLYLAVAAIVYWVLPRLEVLGIDPANPGGPMIPMGIALRGYGFFLLLGMLLGGGVTVWRCQKVGIEPDKTVSLIFWMVVVGIVGARLFYIIQKRDDFFGRPDGETLMSLLDMTKGGLVVYGSVFGGILAATVFCRIQKLSLFKIADLLAPGMVLGLAIGRLGCLMNGCCYGGVCDPQLPNLKFPTGSPPYMHQLIEGTLLGMTTVPNDDESFPVTVEEVEESSLVDRMGLVAGDRLALRVPDSLTLQAHADGIPDVDADPVLYVKRLGKITLPANELPRRSKGVHPTQVYSSTNAALLFLFLWFYYPFRKSHGEVFAMMLMLYAVARFILEMIRTDEGGQFGTSLTISQWVSVFMLVAGIAMFGWVRSQMRLNPAADGQPVMAN